MPHTPSTSASPSPRTGPTHLPPSARRSRAAAAGLHLVFDAAGDRAHLAGDASSPSSYSDASFSSASSAGPATPRSRACTPAHGEDEDCWNLIPYHVPWGNEYYDYTPGMLPGPDGQCFFYRSPTPLKYKRTMRACTKCRDRKAKCSGDKPACTRCIARGYLCHYDPEEPKRAKGPELARQRLREKGASSPSTPRASSVPARAPAAVPCVVPKREEVDMLNELGELAYPITDADAGVPWGAPLGVPEPGAFASPSYALQGALDPRGPAPLKASPQSPPLPLQHVTPSHPMPSDYWAYAAHQDPHGEHPTAHHPASVHAPQPVKQVPPFLSAPGYDEPPPAAPPPIVIPQPPILQAALMAVPEPPPPPPRAPAGLEAFVAYSAQELLHGYIAYDYAPGYAAPQEYHGHAAQAFYDAPVYGQGVGVAPAATYLAPVPAAPYVSYAA